MITLYNNPLCIFHKRPNLWWHYWQLTVASVLWIILIKAFIGPLFTVWRRAGWGFLRGRPFLLLPWIVSCQDDFEKLKHNVAPAGDLAIDHLNHVVSGLNTAGIHLLPFQFQNISTGTSTKISHYHTIWYLTSDYLLHEQRKLPLAISLGQLHIWSIIPIFNCKHYFFLNHIVFYFFHCLSFHN